jgi:hypothetical protein
MTQVWANYAVKRTAAAPKPPINKVKPMNIDINTEAKEVVKAAEAVRTHAEEVTVQQWLHKDMQCMSPAQYKQLIDKVVGLNAADRCHNPHLPELFHIHQSGGSNSDNIGFSFNPNDPVHDQKEDKALSGVLDMLKIGDRSASTTSRVRDQLLKDQQTLTTGEFRQLYAETRKAEVEGHYANPLKAVDSNWHFIEPKK